MNKIKTTRCTHCRSEFTDEELVNAKDCPVCGTTSLPMSINEDVTIKINWHELRILGLWAEGWAMKIEEEHPGSKQAIQVITDHIEKQFPLKTPLTLRKEFDRFIDEYPTAKLVRSKGKKDK